MEIGKANGRENDLFWEKSLSIYARQLELIASNIANADTPNYKARDLDFKSALSQAMASSEAELQSSHRSRTLHPNDPFPTLYRVPSQGSVDNNTVDMDVERAAFADTAVRYELAIQKLSHEYKEMEELFRTTPY
ncbi:flagellar basal body rod protein FlgB [Massilia varians]|uniref:Flagellar basal body rod protein FlgB n=1 Tax=Massilia varians TaxID=457921 RepID=A0ABN6TAH9_9BURK|nr:flagellar basal body rod protein FlgB [Massilia varians]BDT59211.1 flagellar basal body rod protein FlgB [Massilia varians]